MKFVLLALLNERSLISLMSAPAMLFRRVSRCISGDQGMLSHDVPAKAFSFPVRTMAFMLSSLSKLCSASFNSINKAVDKALRALGRLRVTDR